MPEMQRITNLFRIRRQRKQYVGNPGGASRAGIGSREVVTTPIEHHSVGRACASLKNSGIAVYTLPVSEEGKIDLPTVVAFTETFVRTLLRGADEQGSCLFGAHYSCGAEKPSPNFLNSLGVQPI